MQVTKTITITTTGVLTVTIVPSPSRGYLGTTFGFEVQWSPVSGYPVSITINYGDGTTETSTVTASPAMFYHSYAAIGTYTITANLLDNHTLAEGTGSTSVEVRVELTVDFVSNVISGVIPLDVTFTVTIDGGYEPYSWTLDYGDGVSESGVLDLPGSFTRVHTYDRVGTFTATLTVTDALGVTAATRTRISVLGVAIPSPVLMTLLPVTVGGLFLLTSKRR